MDSRIPIEEFADFNTCRLVGAQAGMRFDAALSAYESARKERQAALKAETPYFNTWKDVYIIQ